MILTEYYEILNMNFIEVFKALTYFKEITAQNMIPNGNVNS